ncbi:FTR1 family iron permease [Pseudoglutamicibacter albus]|uniref:FTR1 family iron permease n=1 Tax=Pseudoglutamicibacter albus TaxID=98671 RepID=UPI00361D3CEE
MFLASLLIGLREGLEASLIIGVLVAYLGKLGRRDSLRPMWSGVIIALVLTAAIGAVSTFGRSRLTFRTQEIIGGSMSILAVVMITGMIFWMLNAGKKMNSMLEGDIDKLRARRKSVGYAVFFVAFISVGREGIETTIILWGGSTNHWRSWAR